MKFRLRAVMAGAVASGLLVFTAGAAFAAPPPAPTFEPDQGPPSATNSNSEHGTITFYDSAGHVVTSGDATVLPSWVGANGVAPSTFNGNATLVGAVPEPGQLPASFNSTAMTGTRAYPVSGAPGVLAGSPDPVLQPASGEETFAQLENQFPHPSGDNSTQFQGLYQIRILTNGGGGTDTQWWVADVVLTGTGCASGAAPCSWVQTYPDPAVASVGSVLTVSPASPQQSGTAIHITDTMTPANVVGSVQFMDGSTPLGSPVSPTAGVATLTTSSLPVGPHNLSAVFTPTDPTQFPSSTSNTVPYTITSSPAQNTSTGLAVNTGAGQAGSPVTFTATVSPTVAPGSVTFQETPTGTVDGTTPVGTSPFVLATSGLPAGPHTVIAIFTPSNPSNFNGSQSAPVQFSLAPSSFVAQSTDVQNVTTQVPAGSIVISTPYTPSNPLNLGTMTLNAAATQFSATAQFTSITVTDTRAGSFPITAKAQSSNLTNTSGPGTINGENLGLTGLTPSYLSGNGINAGTNPVTTFDNPAANPAVSPADPGTAGLGGGVAHTIATVNNGPGTFFMTGTVTLNAPSSTPAGTYNGTITFTVG